MNYGADPLAATPGDRDGDGGIPQPFVQFLIKKAVATTNLLRSEDFAGDGASLAKFEKQFEQLADGMGAYLALFSGPKLCAFVSRVQP